MVSRRSGLFRFAAAFTLAAGAFGFGGNRASAQVNFATGVAGGSTYTLGYTSVPATVQSDAQLATYLTTNPITPTPTTLSGLSTVVVPNGTFPIPPWMPDTPASAWIAPTTNGGSAGTTLAPFVDTAAGFSPTQSSPQGLYYYSTTFNLASTAVAFSGLGWASDNQGVQIYLNGHAEGDTNSGDFTKFTSFSLNTADLVTGVNTLTFVTFNEEFNPAHFSPTGLDVQGSLHSIPEPGVMTLAAVAALPILGLGWARRRRTA